MSIWLGYQIVALFFGSKHSRHLQNSQWSHFLSFYRISQFLLSFWNHLFTTQLYTPTRPVTPALHFRLNNILSFETYLTIRKLIENLKKRKNRKNLLTIVIPRANHVKSQGRTCFPTVRVSECWFLQVLTRSDRYSLNDRCWNTDSKGQTILESNKKFLDKIYPQTCKICEFCDILLVLKNLRRRVMLGAKRVDSKYKQAVSRRIKILTRNVRKIQKRT